MEVRITRERLVFEYRRVLTYFSDWIFIILITGAAYRILQTGNFFTRIGLPLMPHAYRVILWSLFSVLVLRNRYGHRYLLAFLFYYPLSESLTTTYYILFHQYWSVFAAPTYIDLFLGFIFGALVILYFLRFRIRINKYPILLLGGIALLPLINQPTDLTIFLAFPVITLVMFFLAEPKIRIDWYIVPFLVLMFVWSLLGFRVESDGLVGAPPVPIYIHVLDILFLLTYLFWIYGCNRIERPKQAKHKFLK